MHRAAIEYHRKCITTPLNKPRTCTEISEANPFTTLLRANFAPREFRPARIPNSRGGIRAQKGCEKIGDSFPLQKGRTQKG